MHKRFTKLALIALTSTSLLLGTSGSALAGKCEGRMFNPVTDVLWSAMAKFSVAGVPLYKGSGKESSDGGGTTSPVCICGLGVDAYMGMEFGFWDMHSLVEVVQAGGCSPIIGKQLFYNNRGFFDGDVHNAPGHTSPRVFKHVHWATYPLLSILGLFTDMTCTAKGGFDFLDPSEIDPSWSNNAIALAVRADALLYSAPPFDLVEPANVILAHADIPVLAPAYDAMHWMWWGNVHLLAGDVNQPHDLTSSAQLAAKTLYILYGRGVLRDNVKNICTPEFTIIPKKSHWRWHLVKPVKGTRHFIAGQTELLWGAGKNPPFKEGNFLLGAYQRKRCCERLAGGGGGGGYKTND